MIPAALPILLEAVVRALVAACVLGVVLRLLRVRNVPAQKAAWGLVLVTAMAMPFAMRWQWLPAWAAVKLPAASWSTFSHAAPVSATAPAIAATPVSEPETSADADLVAADRYDVPSIPYSDASAVQSAIPETPTVSVPPPARIVIKPAVRNMRDILPRIFSFAWMLYLGVAGALLLRLTLAFAASVR